MRFRERLLATLRDVQPILDVPGVMVGGSQVPNLLEPDAAATLVVSQDVDLVVPVGRHGEVKAALEGIRGHSPAPEEPSVWTAEDPERFEVNFIGLDPATAARGDVARLLERLGGRRLTASLEALHRRVREIRSRAAVRRWELKQLAHAGGAWFRLQRLLAGARSAWTIGDADAEALAAAGHAPEPAGLELEPPRRFFLVGEAQLASLPSARQVPLVASPELLGYDVLALVPFDDLKDGRPVSPTP